MADDAWLTVVCMADDVADNDDDTDEAMTRVTHNEWCETMSGPYSQPQTRTPPPTGGRTLYLSFIIIILPQGDRATVTRSAHARAHAGGWVLRQGFVSYFRVSPSDTAGTYTYILWGPILLRIYMYVCVHTYVHMCHVHVWMIHIQ